MRPVILRAALLCYKNFTDASQRFLGTSEYFLIHRPKPGFEFFNWKLMNKCKAVGQESQLLLTNGIKHFKGKFSGNRGNS